MHAGKIKAYVQFVLAVAARALRGRTASSRRRSLDAQSARYDFRVFLVVSEPRGPHATGIAWLNREGQHRVFKRPMPARQFVEHKLFPLALAGVDNRTTALFGHTRWRTRGDEHVNRNNHPIRAGDVIDGIFQLVHPSTDASGDTMA